MPRIMDVPPPSYVVPTIGRIVHYYDGDLRHPLRVHAAIVTNVYDDVRIDLETFGPFGECLEMVCYSEEPKAFHWTWPPRVDGTMR